MIYDCSPHVSMVAEFHAAFRHPCGSPSAVPLAADRWLTRTAWALDELFEQVECPSLVAQVDALCDGAYFLCGSLVEMGVITFAVPLPAAPRCETLTAFRKHLSRLLLAGVREEELLPQCQMIRQALSSILTYHQDVLGVPFCDVFSIVHQANMAKLWPDGTPRYAKDDGKVMKPDGWIAPETRIAAYLLARNA